MCVSMSHISALCVHVNMHTMYMYACVYMCITLICIPCKCVCVCVCYSKYICIPVYDVSVCPNLHIQMEGAPQIESAPPPSRSPGNNAAGLSIWCLSSICGAPHRLLLGYPALMPPQSPDLPESTPLTPPPSPAPLVLHWENIPSPGPWAEEVSEELPVPSRLCQAEPEDLTLPRTAEPLSPPPPPFPFPPEVVPAGARSFPGELPPLLTTAVPVPDEPCVPLATAPPELAPSAPPVWECAK